MTLKSSKENSWLKNSLKSKQTKVLKTFNAAEKTQYSDTHHQPYSMRTSAVRSLLGHWLTVAKTLLSPASSCVSSNMAQSANL